QIEVAFMANPGLNALIIGVLLIGIVLSARQVIRLYPEIAWVNNFRLADPGLAVERPPVLLAPMGAILGSRVGRMAMSAQLMGRILGSVGGVIQGLKAGGDAGSMFDSLREGLAAPLSGMGISFSSSLFGLAGSLV